MTEYATPTVERSPVMDPVIYWRISAFALAAVALLGIVLTATSNGDLFGGFLTFDMPHNLLHVVLALAAFAFAFAPLPGIVVRRGALAFGVVYGLLGILGFVLADVGPIHLELGENLIHLVLGAWGLVAGLGGKP